MSNFRHVLLVRPSFEEALVEEAADRWPGARRVAVAPGLAVFESAGPPPPFPLMFERQRIPDARFIGNARLKPVSAETAAEILGPVRESGRLWTTHVFTPDPDGSPTLAARAAGLEAAVRREAARAAREMEKRFRPSGKLARRPDGGLVAQFCLVPEGLWHGVAEVHALSSPCAGGAHRMGFDPRAPSRSYLKMEEALDRMGVEPAPGERVVDLGAAPGGWSFSFLRRGCEVTAVDNGPMKIEGLETLPGRLTHVRADGITYEPRDEDPADWLVADMLVAPGVAMGLLRRWAGGAKARRFVVNLKIPQEHPWPPIRPVLEMLRGFSGRWSVRQLYHDRREVTVMGWGEEDRAGRTAWACCARPGSSSGSSP